MRLSTHIRYFAFQAWRKAYILTVHFSGRAAQCLRCAFWDSVELRFFFNIATAICVHVQESSICFLCPREMSLLIAKIVSATANTHDVSMSDIRLCVAVYKHVCVFFQFFCVEFDKSHCAHMWLPAEPRAPTVLRSRTNEFEWFAVCSKFRFALAMVPIWKCMNNLSSKLFISLI